MMMKFGMLRCSIGRESVVAKGSFTWFWGGDTSGGLQTMRLQMVMAPPILKD